MKRRYILGGLGLALLSLRSQFSQMVSPQKETVNTDSSVGKDNLVNLKAKQEFILPKNPTEGHFIVFRAEEDLHGRPAIIRRNGSLIMGKAEDLEVDLQAQFTLIYSESHKTWGIS